MVTRSRSTTGPDRLIEQVQGPELADLLRLPLHTRGRLGRTSPRWYLGPRRPVTWRERTRTVTRYVAVGSRRSPCGAAI
jgi:hypothetical protein